MLAAIDKEYNRWTVLGYAGRTGKAGATVLARLRCKCGTETVKALSHVVQGNSRSCGCIRNETTAKRNTSHGLSKRREYQIWKAMKQRCSNNKHAAWGNYGGRGITVCARWCGKDGFTHFLADMGAAPPKYTLERKNTEEGYNANNCSWETRKTQGRNKRNNLLLTHAGKTQCLSAWAEEVGLAQGCLYYRIAVVKWPVEKALFTPSAASK